MAKTDTREETNAERRAPTRAEGGDELSKKDGSGDEKKGDKEDKDKDKPDEGKGGAKDESRPPSKKVLIIGGIVLVVLLLGGLLYWLHARQFVKTDDAYTTGHVHQVSSRVPGLVNEVRVGDNQHVKTGDILVVLDARDYEVSLSRARAALREAEAQVGQQQAAIGQTRAGISSSEAQVERARAQIAQARAQLEKARLDYERISGLFTRDIKAVSRADVDAATANFETARSMLDGNRAQLAAAVADAQSSRANAEASEAQLEVRKASAASALESVRNAELQLSYTRILAPVNGKISKKTVEEGQQLQAGQALLAVVPDDVWVIANLKESQLEQVRVGQRVDVEIDTLPHKLFFGSVQSIQEGTGATFSLLPPDNATGNFTKIVQRVPVKIVFDPESIRDFREKIVPGLSVIPSIDLRSLEDNRREAKRTKREQKQNRDEEKHAR